MTYRKWNKGEKFLDPMGDDGDGRATQWMPTGDFRDYSGWRDPTPLPIRYRPVKAENLWDRECLKLNTAIRAVWLLYRRGKWELLESIMLPRAKYEEKFLAYDMKYITSERGLLRTEQQTEHFADSIPGVRVAASILIEDYRDIYAERMNE